jgi:LPXTG-motif cell wall-anchored protein
MKRSSSFSVSRRGALAASTVAALGAAMVAVPLLAVSASATQPGSDGSHKVTICHRNNDDKKPYVVETVDIASSGLLKAGHNDHTGDIWSAGMKADHDKWGDIIPAYHYQDGDFSFDFPGLNWGSDGQAIYDNGCKVVLPTPTPTETTPTPTPTETSQTPEPTPTETTATPEPSQSETSASGEPSDTPTPTETTATPEPTPTETTATPEPTPTETTATPEPTPTETTATPEPTPSESTATEVPTTAPATPESSAPEASSSESTDPGIPSTGGTATTLPKTGSDSAAMLALAAGLVTMGAASIVVARRRTEVESD